MNVIAVIIQMQTVFKNFLRYSLVNHNTFAGSMKTKASSKTQAMPHLKSQSDKKGMVLAQKPSEPAPANPYHHGDLRNALIAAGRAALEDLGVRELSLRSVAKSVGVSEAAPSRHFNGKEGLLAAMAAQGFRELAEKRKLISESAGRPEEKVRQMMHQYVEFAQMHKGLFNLMVGPRIIQPGAYEELKESSTASFNLFAEAVCHCARAYGWPVALLNLVVHSAWTVEHGLATLILGTRAPNPAWPVDLQSMIDFSISLFISRITAGPDIPGATPVVGTVADSKSGRTTISAMGSRAGVKRR